MGISLVMDRKKRKANTHKKKKTSEPIGEKKIGRWGMLCCREHSSVPPGAAHEKHSSCAKWNEEKQSAGMLYLHGGVLPYRNVRSITKCTKIRARLTVQTQRGFSFFSAISPPPESFRKGQKRKKIPRKITFIIIMMVVVVVAVEGWRRYLISFSWINNTNYMPRKEEKKNNNKRINAAHNSIASKNNRQCFFLF